MSVTRVAAVRLVWKEVRVLLPVWTASVAATALVAVARPRAFESHAAMMVSAFLYALGTLAFPLGALSLGALSMGHEFDAQSAGVMVGLPVARRLNLLAKFATLAVALAVLGLVAHLGSVRLPFVSLRDFGTADALLLTLLCGLALAPAFTLWSGSPVGGAALAAAVPVALLLAGETIGQFAYGAGTPTLYQVIDLGQWILWRVIPATCLLGVAWTVYAFDRREWGDGRFTARRLSDVWPAMSPALAGDHSRRGRAMERPLAQLLVKDLTLQTPTLVLLLGYVAAWTLTFMLHQRWPLVGPDPDLMGGTFAALIALVAGAMAFAPERALGTHLLNRMLPTPALRQWVIKAGLAFAIALTGVTAVGLFASRDPFSVMHGENLIILGICVGLTTAVSLHASSFAATAPRAVLLAIVSVFVAYVWGALVGSPVSGWLHHEVVQYFSHHPEMHGRVGARIAAAQTDTAVLAAMASLAAGLPLRLSYLNFRRADQPAWPWRQVIAIGVTASALLLLVTVGLALMIYL